MSIADSLPGASLPATAPRRVTAVETGRRNPVGPGPVGPHDVDAPPSAGIGGIDDKATVGTPAGMLLVPRTGGDPPLVAAVRADGVDVETPVFDAGKGDPIAGRAPVGGGVVFAGCGEPSRRTAAQIEDEDLRVAEPVGGKSQLTTVRAEA